MKVKLSKVRLSFPDLFKAVEFKTGDGKPRYNATFLIEPGSANDTAIQAAIEAAAAETYGAKAKANLKSFSGQTNKYCYLDGDTVEYDGYAGMMYLACHSKARPLVIDRNGITSEEDKVDAREYTDANLKGVMFPVLTERDGKPYAGCYVNVTVDIYAQTGEFPGIRAGFSGVQFMQDGDAFGTGGSKADVNDFDNLGDSSDDDLA